MNINNMLPPRGLNPERLETDAQMLRTAVEQGGARTPKRGLRRVGLPLVVAVAVAGAGGVAAAAILSGGHIVSIPTSTGGVKSFPVSTNLHVAVSPDQGPIGTTVNVDVTGCFDPDGKNHAVSFAKVLGSASYANSPVTGVNVTQSGTTLTGHFRVPNNASNPMEVWVQCGASNTHARFTVTGTGTPSAPPCRSEDVAATFLPGRNGASMHLMYHVRISNISPHPCWLQGTPEGVRFTETNGRTLTAHPDQFDVYGNSGPMAHGHTTNLTVSTESECNARPGGIGPTRTAGGRFQLLIGHNWVTAEGAPVTLDLGCGVGYGNYNNNEY